MQSFNDDNLFNGIIWKPLDSGQWSKDDFNRQHTLIKSLRLRRSRTQNILVLELVIEIWKTISVVSMIRNGDPIPVYSRYPFCFKTVQPLLDYVPVAKEYYWLNEPLTKLLTVQELKLIANQVSAWKRTYNID